MRLGAAMGITSAPGSELLCQGEENVPPLLMKQCPEDFAVVEMDPTGHRVDESPYSHPLEAGPEAETKRPVCPVPTAPHLAHSGPRSVSDLPPARRRVQDMLPPLVVDSLSDFAATAVDGCEPLVLGDEPYLDKTERGCLRVAIRREYPALNTIFRAADGALLVTCDADVALLAACIGRSAADRLVLWSLDPSSGRPFTATYLEGVTAEQRRLFHGSLQRVCPKVLCRVEHGHLSFRAKRDRIDQCEGHAAGPDNGAPLGSVPLGLAPFTHFIAMKRHVDSLRLLAAVAEHFGVSDGCVAACGLKDAVAVTWQRLSVRGDFTRSASVNVSWPASLLGGAIVLSHPELRYVPLSAGSLSGNAFRVVLRWVPSRALEDAEDSAVKTNMAVSCESSTVAQVLQSRANLMIANGGFPNYFGPQRFSRVSLLTRHPGVHLIAGRWADAFDALLDGTAASAVLLATGDPGAAAATISGLAHRDAAVVLGAMRRVRTSHGTPTPLDPSAPEWQDACRRVLEGAPFALRQLWLHAAQSLIFNMLLSSCMAGVKGDGRPAQLPLLGSATIGPAMEALPQLLPQVLSQLGLSADHFALRCVVGVPLRGGWRDTSAVPRGLTVTADGESSVVLKFELPPSAYATMLLRDILGYVPEE